jgi:hypothetical protein
MRLPEQAQPVIRTVNTIAVSRAGIGASINTTCIRTCIQRCGPGNTSCLLTCIRRCFPLPQ